MGIRDRSDSGAPTRGVSHYRAMFDATASTDRLIELILQEDKDVLRQLLTTDKVVATKADNTYFGKRHTRQEQAASVAAAKKAAAATQQKRAADLAAAEKQLAELEAALKTDPETQPKQKKQAGQKKKLTAARKKVTTARTRLTAAKKKRPNVNH